MKKFYIALKIHTGQTNHGQINLPEGAYGLCFVFETKTAARKFWGKDVEFIEIIVEEKQNDK